MKLKTTLITAVLATHTASALPTTGGGNVNEKTAFNQRLEQEMLNNAQSSSGVLSRDESWVSKGQVDSKLADSAFRSGMAIRVIQTSTSPPAPWDVAETPTAIPALWDEDSKLPSVQQRSHIPTHPEDGGKQLVNAVGVHSELQAEQGPSTRGVEDANMARNPLPASDISPATSRRMGNARSARDNTATSASSENQQPGLKSTVRELLRALVHGKEQHQQHQQQHAAQEKGVHDRVRLAARNHEMSHKEAQQQGSSEPSIGVRQMSLSSGNSKAMTGMSQDAMSQNQEEKQEVSSSGYLNPRSARQVGEGERMRGSQSELMDCVGAAGDDINKCY
ncbi:uncharacterized protein B0T15DRAFT_545048 [Chaetomium strumarium]|uniref:Uncharacterized protein n=1 Tax=Chaetomium strumarium TaxID=1170767 RepID=A0AAJ0M576_9PEZI|nr:hypothetical protein B0T15DRAFT_545048 [Chaetomium strumarium]